MELGEDTIESGRNFNLVVLEISLSTFTTAIFTVLILWMAISYTGSPLITGITSAMMTAPLVFNIVVGGIIDNTDRKKGAAIFAQSMKAVGVVLLLPVLYSNSLMTQTLFLFSSALIYGFTVDILVSTRAIWGQQFIRKQVYLKGMSIFMIASRVSRLSGLLVAAALVAFNIRLAITVIALLYIISIIPVFLMGKLESVEKSGKKLRQIMSEGISYITKTKIVASLVLATAVSSAFLGMTDSVSSVMVSKVFGLNAAYLSYILISLTLGGIVGSSFSSRMKGVKNVGQKLALIFGGTGAITLVIGGVPTIYTILVVFIVIGALTGISSPLTTSVLFGNVPKDKMGRVQGAMDTLGTSFNSLSGVVAGVFMTIVFPGDVFFLMGAGLIVLAVVVSRSKSLSVDL